MKSFLLALTLGILAGLASWFTFLTSLPTWVLFLAWTSYFLFGQNIKSTFLIFIQMLLGILLAIIIIYLGDFLEDNLGSQWFHCSVAIVLFATFYVTKLKVLNMLTAYFLGMVIWFASNTELNWKEIFKVAIVLIIGLLFGWLNHNINKQIENLTK